MGTCANSQDPDEVSRNETFHQGLQCLVFKEEDTFFFPPNYNLGTLNIYSGHCM